MAVRKTFAILLAAAAITIAGPGVQGAQRDAVVSSEKSLLGVRILASYRTVFAKFGEPTRIYRFDEPVTFSESVDINGVPTGSIAALGAYATDKSAGGAGGMGGAGGLPGFGGGSGSFGGSSAYGGAMAGAGGQGPKGPEAATITFDFTPIGFRTQKKAAQQGPGGFSGSSMPGAGMLGGGGGSDAPEANTTFGESGGFIWVYYYPSRRTAYIFVFNSAKRLEAIIERGRSGGGATSRGIALGSEFGDVYHRYGQLDSLEDQGKHKVMNYNERYHASFSVTGGRVTGIAVYLREDQRIKLKDENSSGGGSGGPGMMGGMGMRRGG